jgi:hypothetical protein
MQSHHHYAVIPAESSTNFIIIEDQDLFDGIVRECIARAKGDGWVRAFERAAEELVSNPFIAFNGTRLEIPSKRGRTYEPSELICQCDAFFYHVPHCWHRAAARVWNRYQKLQAQRIN